MKEEVLLDEVLEILDKEGAKKAYKFLEKAYEDLEDASSQVYNYLYCLAAILEKKKTSIKWLKKSIEEGFWYRPEVLEDEDLSIVRNDRRFVELKEISDERYERALEKSKLLFTWEEKRADNIAIVLHGNQQNNEISREHWGGIKFPNTQVEYLQSSSIDSYKLFRWEDEIDYSKDIIKLLEEINIDSYDKKTLFAFSSGCNVVLKLLFEKASMWDKAVLVAPWILYSNDELEEIADKVIDNDIEITIICGELDKDCFPKATLFDSILQVKNAKVKSYYLKNLRHTYPDDLSEYVY